MANIGVGLYDGVSAVNTGDFRESLRGQAELLVPMAKEILERNGLGFSDVDAIVTPLGPGTFTGLRIGLAAAKSFALALDIPVFGISTLQALALQYVEAQGGSVEADRAIIVLVETKRSDFYVQVFDGQAAALTEADCYEVSALEVLCAAYPDAVMIGDAVQRFGKSGQITDFAAIDPAFLARAALLYPQFFTRKIEPIYLRGADVSAPKTALRTLSS